MGNKFVIIFLLIINFSFSQQKEKPLKEIAIIFDGIPIEGIELSNSYTLTFNYELTRALNIIKVPSVGFVNEKRIAEPLDTNLERRKVVLELWTKNNLTLGNYTYSRLNPNEVSYKEYINDIKKGEKFSNEFLSRKNKKVVFFRFPFEGRLDDKKKEKKILNFIKKQGYTIVPKTISNDDKIFDICYLKAKSINDSIIADYVVQKYLEYTTKSIEYYEKLSIKLKGKYIPQIFSLHMNLINTQNLPYIISILQSKGYKIVDLNTIINKSIYLNMSQEQKMENFWKVLNNGINPKERIKLPVVIEALYNQQKKKKSYFRITLLQFTYNLRNMTGDRL